MKLTMSVRNRERRRQKHAKRERDQRRRHHEELAERRNSWDHVTGAFAIELLIADAAQAVYHDRDDAPELIRLLIDGPPVPRGRHLVIKSVVGALHDQIAETRSKNWRPTEIQRVARRRWGTRGADVAVAAMRGEAVHSEKRAPSPSSRQATPGLVRDWAEETRALGAADWVLDPETPSWSHDVAAAIAVLGLLMHLPGLPATGRATDPSDRRPETLRRERVLEKVRALLAKAESTSFPDEAAALTAKAQELLTRHSLEDAVLHAGEPSARKAAASARRVWIDEPYVSAKAHLLSVVALANGCRCVMSDDLGFSTVAGHDDDLDSVEILFTTLLVQATIQMTAAGPRTDARGRSRTRSFRRSFLVAFAIRIGERLREGRRAGESAAAEHVGSTALVPVLAKRDAAAEAAINEMFPDVERHRVAATDHEGWLRGTIAADLAALDPELSDLAAAN